jgi:hypothetical protein
MAQSFPTLLPLDESSLAVRLTEIMVASAGTTTPSVFTTSFVWPIELLEQIADYASNLTSVLG